MPEDVTPQNRLARLITLLAMEPDATADNVLNKLGTVLEALGMDPAQDDTGGAVLKKAMQLLTETIEERREAAKVQAMSEYRTSPSTMVCTCSAFTSQALKDRHLPPLSADERERVDLIVPQRR